MGIKDREQTGGRWHKPQHHSSDDEDSHQTMSMPAIDQLSLHDPPIPAPTPHLHRPFHPHEEFRSRPIKKRRRRNEEEQMEIARMKVRRLQGRVEELETQLGRLKEVQQGCPHCHFHLNQPQPATPRGESMPMDYERGTSRESVEFEKVDFKLPLMYNPDLEEKSWVLLGTMLIAMGSKVTDMDGTVSVFKVVKEAVDDIRRQVEKSKENIRMDFFLSKEQYQPEGSIPGLDFDPFYHPKEPSRGLQLQCVRVESVEQCDLVFDQKLCFDVRYETLLTLMEFMKENSSISYG